MDRAVAEQHVEELPGVRADDVGRERDTDLEEVGSLSAIASTRPTISALIVASSMAETGISTLCSTAMARARSSIDRTSLRTR